jgi:uncharacterized protein (TIGR03435 family)
MKIELLAFVVASSVLSGQTFEVASIRVSAPNQMVSSIGTDPGAFNMHNISLRRCIEWAFEVNPNQLIGPAWLNDAEFDIMARAEDHAANDDALQAMLRTLLAERFGLKVHHEQKEMQVYALTIAKGGLKLHAAGTKDASRFVESPIEGPSRFEEDKTGAIAERVSMADIARKISTPLGRVVRDETGLKGRYDFRIDLTPYMTDAAGVGDKSGVDVSTILFAGFNDQLGLKLEPGKELVDLVVIDAVNRTPTEN